MNHPSVPGPRLLQGASQARRFCSSRLLAALAVALVAVFASSGCSAPQEEEAAPLDLFSRLGPGQVFADYLTEQGPFSDHDNTGARPGDIMLKNSKVWFVIAADERMQDWYIPYSGGIVDADIVRDEDDPDYVGIGEFHPLVGLSPLEPHSIAIVNDGSDGEPARVKIVGTDGILNFLSGAIGLPPFPAQGLHIEIEYILGPDSNALEIVTRVANEGMSSARKEAGDMVVLGDDEANQFSVPGGFDRSALVARPPAMGSSHDFRHWALVVYGEEPLQFLGGDVGAQAFGGGSNVFVYSAASQVLSPGEELVARRFLAIDRDISSALEGRLDLLQIPAGEVTGVVRADGEPVPGARVSFLRADDESHFEGQAIADAEGRFSARLPVGEYQAYPSAEGRGEHVKVPGIPLELGEGRPPGPPVSFSIAEDQEVDVGLSVGAAGRVRLSVSDEAGEPLPAKISFIHMDGEDELDERDIFGEQRPYASRGFRKVFWTPDGEIEGEIRPGTYKAVASRGPTYEIDVRESVVVVAGAEPVELDFTIAKVVDTFGHVAFDGHQHAAPSPDGGLTMPERVITSAAEGLDVMVATDHDKVVDFRPLVDWLGLGSRILAVPGTEVSTTVLGHHNVWPMTPDDSLPNAGSPLWWGTPGDSAMTLDEIYDDAISRGAIVLQLNHGVSSSGLYRLVGYDLETGEVGRPEYWSDKFNAMELYNGQRRSDRLDLVPIWFSFLNRGERLAGTATSDSHRRIPEPGSGRTWVLLGEDDPAHVDPVELAHAVVAMRTVPSTGPFIRFSTKCGAEMGDLVAVGGGIVFDIQIQAPSWMPLDRVQLIANGEVVETFESGGDGWKDGVVRFEKSISVDPEEDTWYAVQVDSEDDLTPVYPGLVPWAISSPIFIDVNGNGEFDPLL